MFALLLFSVQTHIPVVQHITLAPPVAQVRMLTDVCGQGSLVRARTMMMTWTYAWDS